MEPDELERVIFFERAKEEAELAVERDPRDSGALTRWGGALLELAHFRQGHDAYDMIELAVEKFTDALDVDPNKHETLWCLGNAYTSQGFLTTDTAQSNDFFEKAGDVFARALREEPQNDTYKKALEMIQKAPGLHEQLQQQLQAQQAPSLGGRGTAGGGGGSSASAKTEFWYDVAGWAILFGVGIAWVSLARTEQVGAASSLK
jgi:tetratricopeptide (TPR) repeat protein